MLGRAVQRMLQKPPRRIRPSHQVLERRKRPAAGRHDPGLAASRLGRALLTAALATVMTRPDYDERAEIAVNADNTAASQLFRRCGFHPDSRTAYFTAQQ
jgi:hypothetical protein